MQNYNTRVSRGVQTSLTPPRPFEQYNLSSVSWIYLTQETPWGILISFILELLCWAATHRSGAVTET